MQPARRVYLDHNATAPMRPEVREALIDLLGRVRGNPSSVHGSGRAARQLLDEARERVAAALGVHEDEVLFTSGGTESNNLAIRGALRARSRDEGRPAGMVTTEIEHPSVLEPARAMARAGHPLELAGVDREGHVEEERLLELAARPGVRLVSVAAANGEVGSVAPLERLTGHLKTLPAPPVVHTDAVQALGRRDLDLGAWGLDLASFSAHKVGGPVGVGVLYRRKGVDLEPMSSGGAQEDSLRPGTESVAAVAAASVAIELAVREREQLARHLSELSRELWCELQRACPGARIAGPAVEDPDRLPGTMNVQLGHFDGKVLVTRLDLEGLEVSAGSACASGSLEPSHVLLAMGLEEDRARAGLRLSLGRTTTLEDVRQAVDILRTTASSARATGVADTSL